MPTFTFTHEIIRGDDTFEVEVEYSVIPLIPAKYGQPSEGGDVEIESVMLDGRSWIGSDKEESEILKAATDRAESDMFDYKFDGRD